MDIKDLLKSDYPKVTYQVMIFNGKCFVEHDDPFMHLDDAQTEMGEIDASWPGRNYIILELTTRAKLK